MTPAVRSATLLNVAVLSICLALAVINHRLQAQVRESNDIAESALFTAEDSLRAANGWKDLWQRACERGT